ncbi:lipoprotein-releasing ABC transporter permease subunit [Alteromonas lipolytica]|uniref:ABC transporter substrate-binding protein n=1 Tax=Alteromonas lipolytica TaxID=1856405 RepID=A0A1E8FKI9_9ALTE|nr:lipoprotein-releasing ABC transporter permease subunit [Alteromonas lipolytica]OFI36424.1 ABC transporter substrate-binding protein [Alteromonas lipolytica]GGF70015.1 transporter [Alteromonas lipolytica]
MAYPLSAYIALRYSTAGKHNSFVAFINRFSVAGIALGLMSLIIVLSVMNGFEAQLRQRILGIVPQVLAHNATVDTVQQLDLPGVRAVSAFREAEGLVQSRQALRGVQLQGIVPTTMDEHSIVSNHMLEGNFNKLNEIKFAAIISWTLARELKVNVGDQIRVMAAGATVYTPFGRMPSQRLVTVAAIFNLGSQLDDKVIYLRLDDLTRLLRKPKTAPADVRLFLDNAFNYQGIVSALNQAGLETSDWRSRQGPLFDAVKMEKNMMFLMLLLIIAVAAFNIVSALVMVVSEKSGDIAILLSQGMTVATVRAIFMLNGIFNGLKGAVIGAVLGILAVIYLNDVLSLLGIHLALSADGPGLPIDVQWHQIVWVTLFSLALCLLASWYPAQRAMKVQPAKVLQQES